MQTKSATRGRVTGGVLLVVAVIAVFTFRPKKVPEPEAPLVRPVKSLVVGESFVAPDLYFPGLVGANAAVDLSFDVAGRLIEMPIKKGQRVKKGELLARLDPRDFQNEVKSIEAEVDRAKSSLDRIAKALASNAVSQEDFSRAKADYDKAAAQLEIKRKALDDTRMLARFDGLIANTFADTFVTLPAGKPILTLQDISSVTVEVAVPEQHIISGPEADAKERGYLAIFDGLPGRTFDVAFKEFTTKAEERTQTYTASFSMAAPTNALILPGMSATVVVKGRADRAEGHAGLSVPSDAVGVDSQGRHFVWTLQPGEGGVFTTRRRAVEAGSRQAASVQILAGLTPGERIATAGISLLVEGRKVTLLQPAASKEPE